MNITGRSREIPTKTIHRKRKHNPKFNLDAFANTQRDPVTLTDVEAAMRQVMKHPAKPQKGSVNREPTMEELNLRWRLARRA